MPKNEQRISSDETTVLLDLLDCNMRYALKSSHHPPTFRYRSIQNKATE